MRAYAIVGLDRKIEIKFLNGRESTFLTLDEKYETAEDICFRVARDLNIGPLCRHLYSLQIEGTSNWLHPNCILQEETEHNVFVFRQRLKVPNIARIKEVGDGTFDYYYHQVVYDILHNNVRGLDYEKSKSKILGLSVADMLLKVVEGKKKLEEIKSDYKKFVPETILKNRTPSLYSYVYMNVFMKNKIISALKDACNGQHEVAAIMESYLKVFHTIAPEYLCEEFETVFDSTTNLKILVNPFHPSTPGFLTRSHEKEQWQHVCEIEDLLFVSIRNDNCKSMEVYRKNGSPVRYKLPTPEMFSFVSLLDGYYRLTAKWNFSLCNQIVAPSIRKLQELRCHGPVGDIFSYAKLQEECFSAAGAYILRQDEISDSVFFLDVCVENERKPRTLGIERSPDGIYKLLADGKVYPSLPDLIKAYRSGTVSEFKLLRCLHPSEDDKSPALICANDSLAKELEAVAEPEQSVFHSPAQYINVQSLQVFPLSEKESRGGKTIHLRAIWKKSERSRVQVAIKQLKSGLEDRALLPEFILLSGKWASLQSKSIVKLYGWTITSKMSLITEYMEFGPLDEYLLKDIKSEAPKILIVDLVSAAASLAKALLQLEQARVVHGYIRCKKIYVAGTDSKSFRVKLSDPGLHTLTEEDIPWVPPEFYGSNLSQAKLQTSADVWAYGTALWEIFSMGKQPEKDGFKTGRLPPPPGCPADVYRLMRDCWNSNPSVRTTPQKIMRDIHRIQFQDFDPDEPSSDSAKYVEAADDPIDLASETFSYDDDTSNVGSNYLRAGSEFSVNCDAGSYQGSGFGHYSTWPCQGGGRYVADTVFQLERNCNVVVHNRSLGSGFFGEVFEGVLERMGREPQKVAVKKVKTEIARQTLKKEIEVMQTLRHPNIVLIVGVIHVPDISLVMEFVPLGSLTDYMRSNKGCNEEA